ncbi:DUF3307 domain-containing protein [Jiulongibacter sediminis]|mgnify:CR=1 FL=1|jgi:hypothetical protein|uniref:DUF3307 domain-containing protein n=1 Tax=Jiulongibacter sediminis TaxID=1605367 RepID=UPI0026EDB42D|nr:DUF3307 domain-containing protein [Jiulongibacter sediminis]
MTITYFILSQLLAHVLTDFIFQNDRLAIDKNTKGFKSGFLIWHALIAAALAWLLFPSFAFIPGALGIGLLHYLIDGFKPLWSQRKHFVKYAFFIDQFLHLLSIAIIGLIYQYFWPDKLLWGLSPDILALTLGFVFAAKPTNVFIRELFKIFEIEATADTDELPKGGRLIGTLERWLVLIFVLTQHFEAIGFLIAAKSILRYKDTDTLKTEYVLIGTMLSFGSAVVIGLYLFYQILS